MKQFLDIEAARRFIEQAMEQYSKTAPAWFTDWLDDLYIRLDENKRSVTVEELLALSWLNENGIWMSEAHAVNFAYHLFDRLGRATDGMLDH